jgi:magnesium transporter
MMDVRVLDGGELRVGGAELLGAPGLTWVDVPGPDAETLGALAERFGLHRLAIEDCLHLDQRPKLEEYPGHQFIVLQGFTCQDPTLAEVELHELHLFLGPTWVLSVHERTHPALARVQQRLEVDPTGTLGRGADFLAYLLADALVDEHFPLLDRFTDAVEELEERIFTERPSVALMQRAFDLKRSLVQLKRVLSPQRDVVGLLARHGVAHVTEKTALYFRDVYDHLVRIAEQLEASRDLVGNAVDAYLSVVANRTGDISRQLTLFASVFMPLSFVVGFFGQNFEGVGAPPFFFVMLTLLVAIPVGTLLWFKHKDWL